MRSHRPDQDWARYWRSDSHPLEAMRAHFSSHVYHRHSHETYSFGVTEDGAQAFGCRNAQHVSAAGMVMAFNPDDPHDGHAASASGFTYQMVHIGPDLLADVLADVTGRPARLPLFAEPVIADARLTDSLRALHGALTGSAGALEVYERLAAAARALNRHASGPPSGPITPGSHSPSPHTIASATSTGARTGARTGAHAGAGTAASAVRDLLQAEYVAQVTADDLARAAGCSRYAAYRAFRAAYGLAPSDYQRQLRLRAARRLLGAGRPAAEVAAAVGFADQAHLTRWFRRYYGITPGAYRTAGQHRGVDRSAGPG
jgi:AraC-like DNA-binding protein